MIPEFNPLRPTISLWRIERAAYKKQSLSMQATHQIIVVRCAVKEYIRNRGDNSLRNVEAQIEKLKSVL